MIDPELALAAGAQPQFDYADPTAARATIARLGATLVERRYWKELEDGVSYRDVTIPNAEDGRLIPIRIYTPNSAAPPSGAIVFYHGGGFMVGDLNVEHYRCLMWAQATGAVLVSSDYRRSPEHRYPAAVDDCLGCYLWVRASAADLKIDPARIVVAGVSAGGNLAASVSLLCRDRGIPPACLQMLIYPALDDRMTSRSMHTHTDQPGWRRIDTQYMWAHYLGPDMRDTPIYAAPARAGDVSGLPPAYVMTAELDPLRDEAIEYALRLMAAGVPVDLRNFAGAFHGFDVVRDLRLSQYALNEQVFAINRAMANAATGQPVAPEAKTALQKVEA